LPIALSSASLGMIPASDSSFALIMTSTRIFVSP
jgi:hypothetical protein